MRIPEELQSLIDGGESVTVEFKESHTDITKDVYETVCWRNKWRNKTGRF